MRFRKIKVILSIGFFAVEYLWTLGRLILGKKIPPRCTVLSYHAVTSNQRTGFAKQMDILIQLVRPIAANNREQLDDGVRYTVMTFDDGFQSVIENAIPELIKRDIPATLFVPTAFLGLHPNWSSDPDWEMYAGYQVHKEIGITAAQLIGVKSDLVQIGSHGHTHRTLLNLSPRDIRDELVKSRELLRSILREDIELLSFPNGGWSQEVVIQAKAAGYKRAFNSLPKLAFHDPDEFLTGRVVVNPNDWNIEFRLKLLGAYRWLARVAALKKKLGLGKIKVESLRYNHSDEFLSCESQKSRELCQ